jgi:release factor glutamine methyltransferase
MPVAYLVGHRVFLDLDLMVDERVLIPRPETELLIERVFQAAERRPPWRHQTSLRVVDVGTGSGAIAIGLAIRLPSAQIAATDISPDALYVAQENAQRYRVSDRIAFLEGDLLAPLSGPVDIIAANLPYISQAEYNALPPDIRLYEPRAALLAGVDGLDAIRDLLAQAPSFLRQDGLIALEIGATQGQAVSAMAARALPDAEISVVQDHAHLDRLVLVQS